MTLRTKLLLALSVLLVVALGSNYLLVREGARRGLLKESQKRAVALTELLYYAGGFVVTVEEKAEDVIGEQMIVEATLAAHLVDVAENYAHFSPQQIVARLKDVADHTVLDEFWITDGTGHAYLRNREEIDFTFPEGATERDQAGAFYKLLSMDRGQVVQERMPREVDGKVFKYAGVSGIDRPRIVQVGYEAASLAALTQGMTLEDFADWVTDVGDLLGAEFVNASGAVLEQYQIADPSAGPGRVPAARVGELAREAMAAQAPTARRYGDVLLVARPSPAGIRHAQPAAFIVGFDDRATSRAIGRMMLHLSLATGAIFAVGMLLAVRISRGIAGPMQRLAREAELIGKGDLDRTVDVDGGPEVTAMEAALNSMSASLKDHIEELRRATAARERIERELQIAADVQRAMLPVSLPRGEGLEVSAFTSPVRTVGGDFYDVQVLPDGRLGFCIGDVSGHGLPAALLASQSLSITRTLAMETDDVASVLERGNRMIFNTVETRGLFVTMSCGCYDRGRHTMTLANAGHLPPILWRRGEAPRALSEEGSLPLGLMPDIEPVREDLALEVGDLLVFYTDGVTEAMNVADEQFGLGRLTDCVAGCPERTPQAVAQGLRSAVDAFVQQRGVSDDLTILALQVTA